jgi:hypothetical protein
MSQGQIPQEIHISMMSDARIPASLQAAGLRRGWDGTRFRRSSSPQAPASPLAGRAPGGGAVSAKWWDGECCGTLCPEGPKEWRGAGAARITQYEERVDKGLESRPRIEERTLVWCKRGRSDVKGERLMTGTSRSSMPSIYV